MLLRKKIYMLQLLPQKEVLTPTSNIPEEAIEQIKSYIETNSCKEMDIDISFMNIIDSCYVSTMCSSYHYIKYPEGKINWIISSELVKNFNQDFSLGNTDYVV